MKKLVTAVALGLLINTASAHTVGFVDIDEPISSDDSYVAYGSDGRVYDIDGNNAELVELAKAALESQLEVEVSLTETAASEDILEVRNEIKNISLSSNETDKSLSSQLPRLEKFSFLASIKNSYVTDFRSEDDAAKLFFTQRTDTKMSSQCYNRAQVWSWELNKHSYGGRKVQVGKIWLYFTKKYIREYKYKWWFHISPYITVNSELRVMDRSFMKKPTPEKEWTDNFIQSKQACPEVFQYSDYTQNQYASHCYVMKSSLWYWQPFQLENAETRDEERSGWNSYEVKKAYRNAIGWFSRVP